MDIFINKFDIFIFDLNNTIVNVENYHYKAWLITLQNILGSEFIFSFDYFCDHFHPKDPESIKNFLSNKLNLWNYDEIMQQKNINYLNILKTNPIKLINGFDILLKLIIDNNKKFIIVSDTYKDNIDFIINKFPILKLSSKIYYRELFNRKFDKNIYNQIFHDWYIDYNKIIYFTYYIIVIDSLYNKDIKLYYINNYIKDTYYNIIKNTYNIECFKDYYELDNYLLEYKIINTLRILSTDMVNKAQSGHVGSALGCAPIIYVLWCKIMKYNVNQLLYDRDRFILSNGHACAVLYSMLYLLGYKYTLDDLKNFRQLNSITPGHPIYNPNLGIEVSTGPLGQGIANGVGMAIAAKKLNLNNQIYVMCGDGCLQEGISYEACSLAGHLQLNNLIILYDDNKITSDGDINITFSENIKKRFKAQNWNILEVLHGDTDIVDIYNKLLLAKSSDKPTIICINTTIGYGTLKSGTNLVHAGPLGEQNTIEFKKFFNFDINKTFYIDDNIKNYFTKLKNKQSNIYYNNNNISNNDYIFNKLDILKNNKRNYSTRDLSNLCLNILNKYLDNIIVGSADLGESTRVLIESDSISKDNYKGKYLNFGIREHAMAAIANGISTYNIVPIISTFLIFSNYCLPAIRMAALSNHKIIYILTHDSIFIGEDGNTHQPIESLTILRSIPNLYVFRPCDVDEIVETYKIAIKYNGPSCLILTRHSISYIDTPFIRNIDKGAYIVYKHTSLKRKYLDFNYNIILITTGSEVELVLNVAKLLVNYNITVISMVCSQIFDQQDDIFKDTILPNNSNTIKISIEAGSTICWYKYANYCYGIDTFGKSAKMDDLRKYFKFTINDIKDYIETCTRLYL